jgi:hypothetical protein
MENAITETRKRRSEEQKHESKHTQRKQTGTQILSLCLSLSDSIFFPKDLLDKSSRFRGRQISTEFTETLNHFRSEVKEETANPFDEHSDDLVTDFGRDILTTQLHFLFLLLIGRKQKCQEGVGVGHHNVHQEKDFREVSWLIGCQEQLQLIYSQKKE